MNEMHYLIIWWIIFYATYVICKNEWLLFSLRVIGLVMCFVTILFTDPLYKTDSLFTALCFLFAITPLFFMTRNIYD